MVHLASLSASTAACPRRSLQEAHLATRQHLAPIHTRAARVAVRAAQSAEDLCTILVSGLCRSRMCLVAGERGRGRGSDLLFRGSLVPTVVGTHSHVTPTCACACACTGAHGHVHVTCRRCVTVRGGAKSEGISRHDTRLRLLNLIESCLRNAYCKYLL